ncbi:MAG: carbohydrate-binding family 9-like protein [Pyrinomonadaceae bacterium]
MYQSKHKLKVMFIEDDLTPAALFNLPSEYKITVDKYWSGETSPRGRRFCAALFWSPSYFYASFNASISEPLVLSEYPVRDSKTLGLWERDVFEIFIAPNPERFNHYFEFEVAPTGEFVDLRLETTSQNRIMDVEYESGMEVAAEIAESVSAAMKIPWKAFGKKPVRGEVWRGNILRAMGKGNNRGYLAWQPTETAVPNFHMPEKFGGIEFS